MNAPQEPHDAPESQGVDLNRRALTKGALAAPVVAGALISRPVLGNSLYHCTVSGKLSGNTSSHGQPQPCDTIGLSPGCWKSPTVTGTADSIGKYRDSRWPSPYEPHVKYKKVFTTGPSGFDVKNTLLTALSTGDGGDIALMRAAIASLLSAAYLKPNFPLTEDQVKQMYQSTLNGGTIALKTIFSGITGNPSWDRDQVLAYFESLYGSEHSLCPAGKP